jgi:NADPH-dependent 2,4-dienoyl-CoA reductase/sulfur reductase-like enzyme
MLRQQGGDMKERLVVVGGVAAGMSAAAKAKRGNRDLEVVVYQRDSHISYAACGLPYFLAGDIADYRQLIVRTPEQMAKQGVVVHIRHEVTAVDPESKTVCVRDMGRDREFVEGYDKLVLATGAQPVRPPLPGSNLEGVFALRSLDSGLAIQRFMAAHKPERAVIVGGGYIGVEMAETFRRQGLDVTMIIRSGKVMRTNLDDDVRQLLHAELVRQGVRIVEGSPVAFEGSERLSALLTKDGRHSCDVALLGMGARPNVGLARAAGITLGASGAIATDSRLRTNQPGVFAAGDCAEALHLVTGQPDFIPLGSTANKQGRVAGTNAAGGRATFGGIVGTTVIRAFDLAVASTGITAAKARDLGFTVQETMIQAQDISHYFPGAAPMHVKLVADGSSNRLLGGQIAGRHATAKRIDVVATALHNRMTMTALQQLDLSYAPPFAPVWDPILVAANVAAR